jgi:ubiquinone/menaquinone biosynthesis C-methylase UbiE
VTAGAQPYLSVPPLIVGMQLAHLAAMTAGLFVAPPAALAALATWSAQPALVFGKGAPETADGESDDDPSLRPPHLGWASALRLPAAWINTLRTAAAGYSATQEAVQRRLAEPMPRVPAEEELFEEPRTTCPWCFSPSLKARIDTTDLFQNKPGTFHLDECDVCGHIFQNPALSIAGLNYYYDEFYEGLGEEMWETIFAAGVQHNRNRVAAVDRQTEPKTWLDVGCGHGHFCLTARQRWPETRFDGVDMSETVREAQRRGWIDIGHFGLFTELAEDLPQIYDVVSMHHYLEHTRDPREELAAATKVLLPGGHLMIEVPDPATVWSRRLGRFWFTWAQPQHLHFVKCEELTAELERMGFEVVSVERGAATLGLDFSAAVIFGVQNLVPSPNLPWQRRPALGYRLKRMVVIAAAVPVFLAVSIPDMIKDARPDGRRIGNAYRVVARAPVDAGDG